MNMCMYNEYSILMRVIFWPTFLRFFQQFYYIY